MWHRVILRTSQMTSTQGKIWECAKYQGLDLIRKRIKPVLVVRLSDCRTAPDHKVAHWGSHWLFRWQMESGKHHSHCKYFKAKTHKGNALLRHNRNNCPGVGLDGHRIHSPLLLWDTRKRACWAMVHPRKEFACQLELHTNTETVLGTSCALRVQAGTVPNRNLARAILLASVTPRVCHPTQALLWEWWMWVRIPKKGWAFLTSQLRFQHRERDQKRRLKLCPVKSQSLFCTSILLVHCSWRRSLPALGHAHA